MISIPVLSDVSIFSRKLPEIRKAFPKEAERRDMPFPVNVIELAYHKNREVFEDIAELTADELEDEAKPDPKPATNPKTITVDDTQRSDSEKKKGSH